MSKETVHVPVLLQETISSLDLHDGEVVLDLTLGGGGHAEAILEAARVSLIGFDADPEAIARVGWRLARFADRVVLRGANFRVVGSVLEEMQVGRVDKALFDLGLSSDELEVSGRGFSFKEDEPLLMTFDPAQQLTAADLLQHLSVEDLTNILRTYGEEKFAFRIAEAIVERRKVQLVNSTHKLVDVIKVSFQNRI